MYIQYRCKEDDCESASCSCKTHGRLDMPNSRDYYGHDIENSSEPQPQISVGVFLVIHCKRVM